MFSGKSAICATALLMGAGGLAASALWAEEPRQAETRRILTEPEELDKMLKQSELRILDTRPQAEYEKGHVPDAVPVDVKSWQELGKTQNGFHNANAWGKKVGQLGISHDSQVVVYGGNLTDAARIWWTLKYLGLRHATLLNGGWQVWVKEKRPTDTVSPKIAAVEFQPKFQPDRLEEIDSLKKLIKSGKVAVVDARSSDEFTGKEVRGKRGGHIPSAKHLEWKELLAKDGRFKSPERLRELFRRRGITPDQTAVTFCQSGGRASVEVFALELAGYPKIKLFVRGWEQWEAEADAPVEK